MCVRVCGVCVCGGSGGGGGGVGEGGGQGFKSNVFVLAAGLIAPKWRHILISIVSVGGLLPDSTQPSPGPMLTNHKEGLATEGTSSENGQVFCPWYEFEITQDYSSILQGLLS